MIWGWLIPGWLRRAALWAAGAALAVFGIWAAGKRDARQKAKSETLRGNIRTRERIDDAPVVDNPDDAAKWLSERDPDKR